MTKTYPFTLAGAGHTLWMILALILTSCTLGDTTVASSGSLRAWVDQPADGFTLPLAPYTIVAHGRQDGGGVTAINFMVNDVLLGSVPTDAGEELTSASLDWNPSAPGWYRIQAVALNGAGQQALSEVSLICISGDPDDDCSAAGTGETSLGAVDTGITVGAAPDPASIGDSCNPADRLVSFEAFIPDTTGAIEIFVKGDLVGASGERSAFYVPLSPGVTVGSYVGTLDLGTLYDGVLAGVDGRLEYQVGLLDKTKESFKTSKIQTLTVHFCSDITPLEGMIKVGGVPDPVYIGKCTPSTIDIEAGTDIDPGMFDHVDLAYVWFDAADTWIGTVGEENRAEMTPAAGGGYWYRLDVNTAPAAMSGGGSIKFRAIIVSTDAVDVAYSEVSAIRVLSCGATVPQLQITATPTKYQPPLPGITPSKTPPPPPPSCSAYNNNYDGCKAAGCNYWSDNTCRDDPEPPPPPPSCSSYYGNPDGCKMAGYCYYWWSDNSCREDPEPPPPDCSSYKTQEDCQAAKCTWDEKLGMCSP